ncbi:hypothetical protein V6N13_008921 [Hibiscus sabdariffa]|uniref:Transmembrane protein n=1 Tax=Hibiscus sabdariffa TaxID=183260 RepID=A0ABR2NQV0_9ROSI
MDSKSPQSSSPTFTATISETFKFDGKWKIASLLLVAAFALIVSGTRYICMRCRRNGAPVDVGVGAGFELQSRANGAPINVDVEAAAPAPQ